MQLIKELMIRALCVSGLAIGFQRNPANSIGIERNLINWSAHRTLIWIKFYGQIGQSSCLKLLELSLPHFGSQFRPLCILNRRPTRGLVHELAYNFSFPKREVLRLFVGDQIIRFGNGESSNHGVLNNHSRGPGRIVPVHARQNSGRYIPVVLRSDSTKLFRTEAAKLLDHGIGPGQKKTKTIFATHGRRWCWNGSCQRYSGPVAITVANHTGSAKDRVSAKCGKLTITIIDSFYPDAGLSAPDSTVRRKDNPLRGFTNDDYRPMGYRIPHSCVWERENGDQKNQRFFVQIKFLDTSISWAKGEDLTVIGVRVYLLPVKPKVCGIAP
jgi:hypothetical protein